MVRFFTQPQSYFYDTRYILHPFLALSHPLSPPPVKLHHCHTHIVVDLPPLPSLGQALQRPQAHVMHRRNAHHQGLHQCGRRGGGRKGGGVRCGRNQVRKGGRGALQGLPVRPSVHDIDGVIVGKTLPQAIRGEDEKEIGRGGEDVRGDDGLTGDVRQVGPKGRGGGRRKGEGRQGGGKWWSVYASGDVSDARQSTLFSSLSLPSSW